MGDIIDNKKIHITKPNSGKDILKSLGIGRKYVDEAKQIIKELKLKRKINNTKIERR